MTGNLNYCNLYLCAAAPDDKREAIYTEVVMHVKIYTDGSSLGNPGPGGFCAVIKMEQKTFIVKGGDAHTTNNRMEISAVIAGLYWLKKNFPKEQQCAVYSDSTLVISTLTKHWKRKKNTDLWEKLDALLPNFSKIEWHWIKGHAGHAENEKADSVAVREATKRKRLLHSK